MNTKLMKEKVNIAVLALLLVFATGTIALAQNNSSQQVWDQAQATGLYAVKILYPDSVTLAELASYRVIKVYSYTSGPGDQCDVVQGDGVYDELVMDQGLVRVKQCSNKALYIEALVPLPAPAPPVVCTGPAGTPGTPGAPGATGAAGPPGLTGIPGGQGSQGLRGYQGAEGREGREGRPGLNGTVTIYKMPTLPYGPYGQSSLVSAPPITTQYYRPTFVESIAAFVAPVLGAWLGRPQGGDTILTASATAAGGTATGGNAWQRQGQVSENTLVNAPVTDITNINTPTNNTAVVVDTATAVDAH